MTCRCTGVGVGVGIGAVSASAAVPADADTDILQQGNLSHSFFLQLDKLLALLACRGSQEACRPFCHGTLSMLAFSPAAAAANPAKIEDCKLSVGP